MLQSVEEMHKSERGKGQQRGKRIVGWGEENFHRADHDVLIAWMLLGKENERKVLDTPSCVEVPKGSLAGRNMMWRVLKKEAGWLRLEEKSVGVESGIGFL